MNIHPNTRQAYQLMHQGILALADAEQQGFLIDLDYCAVKKKQLTKKIEALEKEFMETQFYKDWRKAKQDVPNISSNNQLGWFLYKVKKIIPPKQTTSGQGATDEEALSQLDIPELRLLLQARKLKKIRDTYLEAFTREQVDGVVHPFFNLHTVRTYRGSSDSPNFQNIPKRDKEAMNICRGALKPRKGHLLMEADFSGIEVRIAACYHKDPTMLKYILDPTTDMHGDMAEQIFCVDGFDKHTPFHKLLRQAAKNGFVFPQFYGDYYVSCAVNLACRWGKLPESGKWKKGQGVFVYEGIALSEHLISKGIKSLAVFTEHIKDIEKDFWKKRFPVYNKWKEKHWETYKKTGYVDLYTGFRCKGIMSRNDAINYPVQGAAFHCLLWSLIRLNKKLRENHLETRIIGQIHDAIVLDVLPEERDAVIRLIHHIIHKELPEVFSWIIVPMEIEVEAAEVDESWAKVKELNINEIVN